jgi:ABC-2 type transport system permease protein
MLGPLASVAIYGVVFKVLFGLTAPTGVNSGITTFALYLLCGLLPWNFHSMIINTGMNSISSNAGLVRRVAFQREVLVFADVAHALVQFSIELSLLAVILLIAGSPILPLLPLVVVVSLLVAVFSAGFALALSVLSVYFRDLNYLWTIVMQIWFFVTPVVYGADLVEEKLPSWGQRLFEINPMFHVIGIYRDLLYHGTLPKVGSLVILAGSALLSLVLGWKVFSSLGRRLPEEV